MKARDLLSFLNSVSKQNPTNENKRIYKEHKKEYNRILRQPKRNHIHKLLTESDNLNKTVWRIINTETGRTMKPTVHPENLSVDNLNEFFTNNANNLIKDMSKQDQNLNRVCYLINNISLTNSTFFRPVTTDDVRTAIMSIKNKKLKILTELIYL